MTSPVHPAASLLTPRGRGAVACIAVAGNEQLLAQLGVQFFAAANGAPLDQQPLGRIVYGRWGDRSSKLSAEDAVLCRISRSNLEVNCHGGVAAADRILRDLQSLGLEVIDWREHLLRVYDPVDAECRQQLALASTVRTAKILLEQSAGLLQREFQRIATLAGESFTSLRTEIIHSLEALLRWENFGRHLTQPWQVVLTGCPNAGKSSLMNVLLGFERSIVFDQPGTTRDVVTAHTAFDGWPVQLADTAGFRIAGESLEAAGIARAEQMLEAADCRILLIDVSQPATLDDRQLLDRWPDAIVVAHKSDLPARYSAPLPPAALPVSSRSGQGVLALMEQIASRLVPESPAPGTPLPVTSRQVQRLAAALEAARTASRAACQSSLSALIHG